MKWRETWPDARAWFVAHLLIWGVPILLALAGTVHLALM